jgi:hypothetical protein
MTPGESSQQTEQYVLPVYSKDVASAVFDLTKTADGSLEILKFRNISDNIICTLIKKGYGIP